MRELLCLTQLSRKKGTMICFKLLLTQCNVSGINAYLIAFRHYIGKGMDCIKLASSTMNGNCKTVISTSAKLMCSASPFHCVPRENHRSMLFRAEKRDVMALLMCLGVFQQWNSFPPLFWSHTHSSNPVWSNLYAHNPPPPDSSLDVRANVVEQFLLSVASCVKNASINNPPCIHESMNEYLCKASKMRPSKGLQKTFPKC